MSSIRARVRLNNDIANVKVLIQHPMESGLRKDARTGMPKAAHFIKEVKCLHNGELVMQADWSGAVSKNPYLAFEFDHAHIGDEVQIQWLDNTGATDSQRLTIDR